MRLRPPSEVRQRVQGERVLAWLVSGTSSLVATPTALVLPEGSDVQHVPWDLVLRAQWVEQALDLTLQERAGGRPVVLNVPVTGVVDTMAGVVRERVNASIAVQRHVPLVGAQGARVVARRVPGETELRWTVVFDSGLDARDPALRARADSALADLRAALGV
jgi:hypothetical protein